MTATEVATDRRCGTCKRWRPKPKRDRFADRHYGSCTAPEPTLAACFTRIDRLDPSSIAGDNCSKWLAGGKHGALK